jgi:uncharacterized membrane protein
VSTLALGLVLFLGIHLMPIVPSLRTAVAARLGDKPYRGAFSLVSLVGLVLIVVGYRAAGPGAQLFAPVPAAIAIAPLAVTIAFILFAAANMRTHLRRALGHPMLYGTLIWSGVHLAANGDARSTLLFGAFFAWALIDLASVVQRHAVEAFEPVARQDLIAIVAGTAVALIVMMFHRPLFGVAVVPFGV